MIRRGQGLLETIFAIGIMLIALSAILALTVSNNVGQRESEYQVIANNLAREGIEVIRSERDANWLARAPWDQGIPSGMVSVQFSPSAVEWTINPVTEPQKLYVSTEGVYTATETNRSSGYSRALMIESVCVPANSAAGIERVGESCEVSEQKIGMVVKASVTWVERGRNRTVELTDVLYAWK